MACSCADEVDEKLKSRNTELERAFMISPSLSPNNPHLMLRTMQIETGRGKPKAVAMFISHCPFCGVSYE